LQVLEREGKIGEKSKKRDVEFCSPHTSLEMEENETRELTVSLYDSAIIPSTF
jgi:hypothetical protein